MISHNNSRKTSTPVFKSTRLLDQLREQIRYLHYSLRTEEAYVYWTCPVSTDSLEILDLGVIFHQIGDDGFAAV
jgi:hypothetical protein